MLGMIKIGEAAKSLGITTMELRDSAHRGEVKFTRTPGGVHYFRQQDLDAFAQKRSQAQAKEEGLKTSEVAEIFGLSTATIAGWAERGYLSCTKTARGTRLFSADEVKALLSKMQGESDESEKDA